MPTRAPRKKPKPLDIEGLMTYAARILSARAQTISELREKLRRRAGRREDVGEVLSRLKQAGYLNDQRFAESFAAWRRDNEGYGKTRVLRDLLARRVAPTAAKNAADAAFSSANETEMIEQFLARRYRGKNLALLLGSQNPDREKHLASAYRKLRTAGFSLGNSVRVLKRYTAEADVLEAMEEAHEE